MAIVECFAGLGLEVGGDGEEGVCVVIGEGIVDIFLIGVNLRSLHRFFNYL
jgi:hypothetical protein